MKIHSGGGKMPRISNVLNMLKHSRSIHDTSYKLFHVNLPSEDYSRDINSVLFAANKTRGD